MARSRRAVVDSGAELAEIEEFYRRRLTAPVERPAMPWVPVTIGPTWQMDGDRWSLPERTLGWQVLAWCGRWLQLAQGVAWRFTDEQARFILWWYAIDDRGVFLFRDAVLQRLKGWGKDPLGACLCMVELLGPCRFGGWSDSGEPIGVDSVDAWVQTAAVSLQQTRNTMALLPGLVTDEAKTRYRVQIGAQTVHALGERRFIQAVTSSPATLEGARATFVLLNEVQHWMGANGGHDMAAVIERNATKSPDGAARSLRITNAYEPGLDSVAERDREAWEAVQDGRAPDTGLLYDTVEAPPEAPLTAEAAPSVVEAVRGDSVWLSTGRIVASILDSRNPASLSRRFWYNQVVAAEDAWVAPHDVGRAAVDEPVLVGPREPIVLFFDGSKSDDSTGLVGCRLSDGYGFVLGVWQRPAGPRGNGWIVPRPEVDAAVVAAFRAFEVTAFWADPSDTRDDTGERFWESLIDDWHRLYGRRLAVWAVQTGTRRHAVAWDMRDPAHDRDFTLAAMRFVSELEAGQVSYEKSAALLTHLRNARRRPNRHGVSLAKEHRESARKVDLAVCLVGARMLRRAVLNKEAGSRRRTGRVV